MQKYFFVWVFEAAILLKDKLHFELAFIGLTKFAFRSWKWWNGVLRKEWICCGELVVSGTTVVWVWFVGKFWFIFHFQTAQVALDSLHWKCLISKVWKIHKFGCFRKFTCLYRLQSIRCDWLTLDSTTFFFLYVKKSHFRKKRAEKRQRKEQRKLDWKLMIETLYRVVDKQ